MYRVHCSMCEKTRQVKDKQPWMEGQEPYERKCKSCCQKGKSKTQECKDKLSTSLKSVQTEEVRQKKSDFMKSHPELWVTPRPDLGQLAWTGQKHTAESKQKIADGVSQAAERKSNES